MPSVSDPICRLRGGTHLLVLFWSLSEHHCVPGTVLGASHGAPHLVLTLILCNGYCPHFTEEETEARGGEVICPVTPLGMGRARVRAGKSGCKGNSVRR